MKLTLQYFDGCPNWETTAAHLQDIAERRQVEVEYQLIDDQESAEAHGFRGSPTVLIDGVDPFADPEAPVGLSCRIYETPDGHAGSPTLEQLEAAIGAEAE